mgnify:CR=1 FL=1
MDKDTKKQIYTLEDFKRWGSSGGKKSGPKNSKRLKGLWKTLKEYQKAQEKAS